jgi:hypothetical protein
MRAGSGAPCAQPMCSTGDMYHLRDSAQVLSTSQQQHGAPRGSPKAHVVTATSSHASTRRCAPRDSVICARFDTALRTSRHRHRRTSQQRSCAWRHSDMAHVVTATSTHASTRHCAPHYPDIAHDVTATSADVSTRHCARRESDVGARFDTTLHTWRHRHRRTSKQRCCACRDSDTAHVGTPTFAHAVTPTVRTSTSQHCAPRNTYICALRQTDIAHAATPTMRTSPRLLSYCYDSRFCTHCDTTSATSQRRTCPARDTVNAHVAAPTERASRRRYRTRCDSDFAHRTAPNFAHFAAP